MCQISMFQEARNRIQDGGVVVARPCTVFGFIQGILLVANPRPRLHQKQRVTGYKATNTSKEDRKCIACGVDPVVDITCRHNKG